MRNHTGRIAIALGSLAAAIAIGSGVAAAAPVTIHPGPVGSGTVTIEDALPPPVPHSCSVYGLGYAWGVATSLNAPAIGGFVPGTPVIGVCTDGSVQFKNAG
ncbi:MULTISPECIES: hypothetical protein [unclassified Nocardia]|uniref:hypothetical protein n=1 Tax=Nocardia sp. NPDC056541 TaxID=3345860 RepID=UPI00366BDF54